MKHTTKIIKKILIYSIVSIFLWSLQYVWIAYQNNKKLSAYINILETSIASIQHAKTLKDISDGLAVYRIAYDNPPELWSLSLLNQQGEEKNGIRLLAIKLSPEVVQKMLIKELDLPEPKKIVETYEKKLGKSRLNQSKLII